MLTGAEARIAGPSVPRCFPKGEGWQAGRSWKIQGKMLGKMVEHAGKVGEKQEDPEDLGENMGKLGGK